MNLRTLTIGFVCFVTSCSSMGNKKPDPMRQPWRDSWAALPTARTADPDGLSRAFAATRAQLMLPFVNAGEDAEAIYDHIDSILRSVGDQRFSEALLRETPETRSAVREFLFEDKVRKNFPRTHFVLADAPIVKWPSDDGPSEKHPWTK
jgi:hypothetical protein